jgi:hypothetical protein
MEKILSQILYLHDPCNIAYAEDEYDVIARMTLCVMFKRRIKLSAAFKNVVRKYVYKGIEVKNMDKVDAEFYSICK